MILKKFKLNIINSINKVSFLFFFYAVISAPISIPFNLTKPVLLTKKINTQDEIENHSHFFHLTGQKSLNNKLYLDLYDHNISEYNCNSLITQINVNKEGKVLGYKNTKVRILPYSIEKQISDLLKKNIFLIKETENIYWLNITNKY